MWVRRLKGGTGMRRLLRFALVLGAGALLVRQYPDIRRYIRLVRM